MNLPDLGQPLVDLLEHLHAAPGEDDDKPLAGLVAAALTADQVIIVIEQNGKARRLCRPGPRDRVIASLIDFEAQHPALIRPTDETARALRRTAQSANGPHASVLAVRCSGAGPGLIALCAYRDERRPFSEAEMAMARLITDHWALGRAAREAPRAALGVSGAAAIVATIGSACCLLDAGGEVREINAAAGAMLHASGLMITGGRMRHEDPALNETLQATLTAMDGGRKGSCEILLSRSPAEPLLGVLTALPSGGGVLLHLIDGCASHDDRQAAARLRLVFGLAPTEAAVCLRLLQGVSVVQIAVERGVTAHTIRTQKEKILRKIGFDGVEDLFRLHPLLVG
ncbi:hypothetical protein BH11PSE2_BH11PSE2_19560 [soil metagenome]